MRQNLYLELQHKKTRIIDVKQGVEFLGGFVKPYRTYISNSTVRRMRKNLYLFQTQKTDNKVIKHMVNSYLGIFSHYKSHNVKLNLIKNTPKIIKYGYFIKDYSKFIQAEA
jgi:hypothetical protein